jgi:hypothetical protein
MADKDPVKLDYQSPSKPDATSPFDLLRRDFPAREAKLGCQLLGALFGSIGLLVLFVAYLFQGSGLARLAAALACVAVGVTLVAGIVIQVRRSSR